MTPSGSPTTVGTRGNSRRIQVRPNRRRRSGTRTNLRLQKHPMEACSCRCGTRFITAGRCETNTSLGLAATCVNLGLRLGTTGRARAIAEGWRGRTMAARALGFHPPIQCWSGQSGRYDRFVSHRPSHRDVLRQCDSERAFARGAATHAIWVNAQATMASINTNGKRTLFHANPGHGTGTESKSPPNGRATGTVRRSTDGGATWEASVALNGHDAYSYSCLTEMPTAGVIGLAFETVLPGSDIPPDASANNIVFVQIPTNFSNATH